MRPNNAFLVNSTFLMALVVFRVNLASKAHYAIGPDGWQRHEQY